MEMNNVNYVQVSLKLEGKDVKNVDIIFKLQNMNAINVKKKKVKLHMSSMMYILL